MGCNKHMPRWATNYVCWNTGTTMMYKLHNDHNTIQQKTHGHDWFVAMPSCITPNKKLLAQPPLTASGLYRISYLRLTWQPQAVRARKEERWGTVTVIKPFNTTMHVQYTRELCNTHTKTCTTTTITTTTVLRQCNMTTISGRDTLHYERTRHKYGTHIFHALQCILTLRACTCTHTYAPTHTRTTHTHTHTHPHTQPRTHLNRYYVHACSYMATLVQHYNAG